MFLHSSGNSISDTCRYWWAVHFHQWIHCRNRIREHGRIVLFFSDEFDTNGFCHVPNDYRFRVTGQGIWSVLPDFFPASFTAHPFVQSIHPLSFSKTSGGQKYSWLRQNAERNHMAFREIRHVSNASFFCLPDRTQGFCCGPLSGHVTTNPPVSAFEWLYSTIDTSNVKESPALCPTTLLFP